MNYEAYHTPDVLDLILMACPYPDSPEPSSTEWEEFGKKVCDILLEKKLIEASR